jgi:hypothetical protein
MNTKTAAEFVAIPVREVREGEAFVAIEKQGPMVFATKRKRWERAWRKSNAAYRMSNKPYHAFDEAGKDAIFAISDFAIVKREPKPTMDAKRAVDTLLRKFTKR